jgi:hypothetical protein
MLWLGKVASPGRYLAALGMTAGGGHWFMVEYLMLVAVIPTKEGSAGLNCHSNPC